MSRIGAVAAVAGSLLAAAILPARAAEPVMVQCGREYQAAKAAGMLNGADWNTYRAVCAARLKTPAQAATGPQPAAAEGPSPSVAPAAPPPPAAGATAPAAGAAAPAAASPATSGGMAAMHARQRQCGAEWRADKPALLARTPGLTWPKYWSQCNARLKAAKG